MKYLRLSAFAPGVFRLVSYEWGVAYGAMLLAGEISGDQKFKEYTVRIGLEKMHLSKFKLKIK